MEIDRFDAGRDEPHAIVYEEDVQLVLSADPTPRPVSESLDALEAAALRSADRAPGSVVLRPGRPTRVLAIVHDLAREPSWRPDWVARALDGVFRETRVRGLTQVAMPLLGTVHGRLSPGEAVHLLAAALARAGPQGPEVLWLQGVPMDTVDAVRADLRDPGPG